MRRRTFLISVGLAAGLFAALAAWLFPYGALGIEGAPERHRIWLLTLWSAGVMAICFGAAGLLAGVTPLGFRDVAEAGSVDGAIESRRASLRDRSADFFNFAGWTTSVGLSLLLIYFVAWIVGR